MYWAKSEIEAAKKYRLCDEAEVWIAAMSDEAGNVVYERFLPVHIAEPLCLIQQKGTYFSSHTHLRDI